VMWFSSPHAFLRLEIEGKVSPVLNLIITVWWRCMGQWCIDSHILDLGTSLRWIVIFIPLPATNNCISFVFQYWNYIWDSSETDQEVIIA
jgi:hypothetical protein